MPRKPKLRASYLEDAQFLLRLESAIMRDMTRPSEWRRNMAERVNSLAIALMQAPASAGPKSAPARGGRSKKAVSAGE